MTNSKLYTVNTRAFTKSLGLAILVPILTYILTKIKQYQFNFSLNEIIIIGISAGLSYIVDKYFRDEKGKFLGGKFLGKY